MKKLIASAALALSASVFWRAVAADQAPQAPAPQAAPAQARPVDPMPSVQGTAKTPGNTWLPARKASPTPAALTPEEELQTFSLPPGYRAELVAAEPLVEDPIIIDFDADGRLWVLELQAFLPDLSGRDSVEPMNSVAVLEDTNGDGKMDKRTVFADKLVLPRALKVLDQGVLVGEPPNLWLMKDTNGDLKADTK
jgi:glucose/arabinose dehydrogenase